jgi:hypothetical protein
MTLQCLILEMTERTLIRGGECIFLAAILSLSLAFPSAAQPRTGHLPGPLAASENPNYFKDPSGNVLTLNGSQSWNTFQDWGSDDSIQPLDFQAFVAFLQAHGHNFTLLWITELPKVHALPTTASSPPDLTVTPFPWQRTGPGIATDGQPRFDLTKFNQSFFDRLRLRASALNEAGIYVGVYLFSGEFLNVFRSERDGYPFTGTNNINGIDDGYTGGPKGTGSITMTAPDEITAIQDRYVDKAIDTLNDLPNVLWIVSEEAPGDSAWWNDHLISHVRAVESRKRFQHPIGYGAIIGGPDSIIYNSDADWVAPLARISPSTTCGNGHPACKVNINDSDHSYWEMWHDSALKNRNYAWQNLMTGNQVLFMDPYLVFYPREGRNMCISPSRAVCRGPDTRWDNFRDNLGYLVEYSRRLNLGRVTPQGSLSSTGYCLAQAPPAGAEYLVYAPSGGPFHVDLSAMPASRRLKLEWFNPAAGTSIRGEPIQAGSTYQLFTPPFEGDAVLYLVDVAGHAGSGESKP